MNLASDISCDFATGGKIYLNNASVSIMPLQSIEAINEFLKLYNQMGPDSISSEPFVLEKLKNARRAVAKIINCQEQEIVLTQSTTDGINYVANGLSFPEGSNIIIRGGAHEHHANYYPWLRLQNKTKVNSMEIDADGFFDFEELGSHLDGNTKLVALSHALYNTGAILPIEKVGKMLGGASFFVDGAQTVGCVADVDVAKINCDFMSFNGSKWLCGPMGTGLFYCRKDAANLLEPISIGGESAMIYDNTKLAFMDMPERFQAGFRNYAGMVGLGASAEYILKFGLENIRRKNRYLSEIFREGLSNMKGVTLYGPQDAEQRTSIISFSIDGMESEVIAGKLEKAGIILAVREILDKKIVRASPHFFNTEDEIGIVLDAIKKL